MISAESRTRFFLIINIKQWSFLEISSDIYSWIPADFGENMCEVEFYCHLVVDTCFACTYNKVHDSFDVLLHMDYIHV